MLLEQKVNLTDTATQASLGRLERLLTAIAAQVSDVKLGLEGTKTELKAMRGVQEKVPQDVAYYGLGAAVFGVLATILKVWEPFAHK
eukprot:scaffold13.g379.t1